jgi:integrase
MPAARIRVYLNAPSDRPNLQLEWRDPETGERRFRSAKTPDPAAGEQRRADLEYELNNGVAVPTGEAPLSWADFRRRYEREYLSTRRRSTRVKAAIVLDGYEAAAAPATLRAASERTVARYADELRGRDLDPLTIRGYLSVVRTALRWAARQKLIAAAPHVEMPDVPGRKRRMNTINHAEYLDLRTKLPDPNRTLLDVAWYTGMRLGELLALRWDEVAGSPWLDVRTSRIWFDAASQKSGKAEWIPAHPRLMEMLRDREKPRGEVIVGLSAKMKTASMAFIRDVRTAGGTITAHDVRRSFGTRYAPVVTAPVLQRLMRHANIQTTLLYYVDLSSRLDEAILLA